MARRIAAPSAPAAPGTTPTPTGDRPLTYAEALAAIPETPTTDEEYRAAYDGHVRQCVVTGSCGCNPMSDVDRPLRAGETAPWPWWRDTLAMNRHRDAVVVFCRARGLLDDRGRPVPDWRARAGVE